MERSALAELRKGIDFAFRDFSRAYGDGIESFFDPLLYFLVWLEKLMINSLDNSKLDKIFRESVEETKLALQKKSS